ncbi:HlyD family efflux transporter periplasmic adaptor subunit [Mariniblastus fucicola]|uniref:Macrolide transporter subunit MacA n=1 Tax=Mariniblastus fucicola TaxID=980251 RepID=A0A5B9PDT4_9BACT|nr:efflux RND transporter periplasmic adaptor subunit [Mariniblastus fucicola]QEG24444.1 macrolide transporter subunit MacA [Mariniblastus fucicola]
MNRQRTHRRGVVSSVLLVGAAICAIIGAIAWFYFNTGSSTPNLNLMTAKVERGSFVAKVLDQGEVQSSENVEIRCEVRARNGQLTVISLVTEGTKVEAGDFLVRLDSTAFEQERESQRIAVANAKANVIQADANLKTAQTTLKEFEEGTYKAQVQDIVNQITDAEGLIKTSESELLQSEDVLKNSMELQAKGFITSRQLESDQFAVDRAKLALKRNKNILDLAKQNLTVLEKYTLEKETVQLKSNIEAALVKLESEKDALRVQERQMAEIEEMITKCEVVVPEGVSGQVVYAKEQRGRGGDEWILEEGANVRESQVLIRLPDTTKMEVKALVNEQNITQIETGMPCSIKVDALTDKTLKGVVTKVNAYAESAGWGGSSVRKYAVKVRIFDPPEALKPGMNASVSIQTKYQEDALMVPIQTIYGVQERQFCLAKVGERYETREIKIGGNNSQMALVLEGLEEGEELVMNPGAQKDLMELPEVKLDKRIDIPEEEAKRAADDAAKAAPEKEATGGPPGGQGGAPDPTAIADRVMQRSDTNGDGKLDKTEIANLDDRSKSWAGTADKNGDGDISKEEVVNAMKKVMKSFGGGRPGGGGRQGGGGGGRPGGGGGR